MSDVRPDDAVRFEAFETALRDGTRALIRPLTPDDGALIAAGFRCLSERSRYTRFMTPLTELSEEQLQALTDVDNVNRFAWVAVRADDPTQGMGVARFVRVATEPEVAEAAVTVVDDYQRRGLGTILVGLLAVAARSEGIRVFRAYVLEDNTPMRDLLESLGAKTHHESPGIVRVDVPLDPQLLADSPASRVLKAVAARAVELSGPAPHWIPPIDERDG